MTDFDKLIREKVEQAEYSYKPSAWRKFQRKAGMGGSTALYWTVGISSVLVVGGIATFFGYRINQNQSGTESSPEVASMDTVSSQAPVETEIRTPDTYQLSETEMAATVKQPVQGNHHSERVVDTAANSERQTKTTHVANPPRYGRPLVIDVDTIKENVPTDEELKNGNSRLF